jgi:DNA-binding protein HU-beta
MSLDFLLTDLSGSPTVPQQTALPLAFPVVSPPSDRSPAVNKSELTQKLVDRTNLSKSDAQKAVDALFSAEDGIISVALKKGEKVQITGFGSFETRKREARTGRNPRTGKEIKIGASTSAAFRAGKGLKDSIG